MQEKFYSWLIFLSILVFTGYAVTLNLKIPIQPMPSPADHRPIYLKFFFLKKHCPEPFYITEYLNAADKYGLDYRLLPAIAFKEQTCWKIPNAALNEFGVGSAAGLHKYKAIPEGMDEAAEILINPRKGLSHYGPADNPNYPNEILDIENQIQNMRGG